MYRIASISALNIFVFTSSSIFDLCWNLYKVGCLLRPGVIVGIVDTYLLATVSPRVPTTIVIVRGSTLVMWTLVVFLLLCANHEAHFLLSLVARVVQHSFWQYPLGVSAEVWHEDEVRVLTRVLSFKIKFFYFHEECCNGFHLFQYLDCTCCSSLSLVVTIV